MKVFEYSYHKIKQIKEKKQKNLHLKKVEHLVVSNYHFIALLYPPKSRNQNQSSQVVWKHIFCKHRPKHSKIICE